MRYRVTRLSQSTELHQRNRGRKWSYPALIRIKWSGCSRPKGFKGAKILAQVPGGLEGLSASWPASSMAVSTSRHPPTIGTARLPLLRLRTTRRFAGKRRELSLAFLKSLVPKPPNFFHPSSDGLHLHAARTARRVLNVPFQSSIRAWMLLHAARRARSLLCGECATRLSSSSLPIGP
jgi:hypothetical protein